jgi:hypothetical protein
MFSDEKHLFQQMERCFQNSRQLFQPKEIEICKTTKPFRSNKIIFFNNEQLPAPD